MDNNREYNFQYHIDYQMPPDFQEIQRAYYEVRAEDEMKKIIWPMLLDDKHHIFKLVRNELDFGQTIIYRLQIGVVEYRNTVMYTYENMNSLELSKSAIDEIYKRIKYNINITKGKIISMLSACYRYILNILEKI